LLLSIKLSKEHILINVFQHHIFLFQTLSSTSMRLQMTAVFFPLPTVPKIKLIKLILFIDLFKSLFKKKNINNKIIQNQIWVFL